MPKPNNNEILFMKLLARVDPELYRIKVALEATKVNPSIMVPIIKAIANMAYSSGFGKIQVFMYERVITQIKAEESLQINLDAIDNE